MMRQTEFETLVHNLMRSVSDAPRVLCSEGNKSIDRKIANRREILMVIKQRQPVRAVRIAEDTGLTTSCITKHLKELCKEGTVEKVQKESLRADYRLKGMV